MVQGWSVLTESQIFSLPGRPNSVNRHVVLWLLCSYIFPMEQTCVDEYIFLAGLDVLSQPYNLMTCMSLIQDFFSCGLSMKLYSGPYRSCNNKILFLPLFLPLTCAVWIDTWLFPVGVRPFPWGLICSYGSHNDIHRKRILMSVSHGDFISLVLVVQTLVITTHWINHHQVDKY